MTIGFRSDATDDEVVSAINTTPLVDVMLVLLIIFLITIPVVIQTVPVDLPKERNVARKTNPENIEIAVTRDGSIFWNAQPLADANALASRLEATAKLTPQPEIHIRGDRRTRFEAVARVLAAARRAEIHKVSFITEPPPRP